MRVYRFLGDEADEDLPADFTAKKFMGFDVMPENGCMTIMARNMGIYFISQCLVFAVHPVDGVAWFSSAGERFETTGGQRYSRAREWVPGRARLSWRRTPVTDRWRER